MEFVIILIIIFVVAFIYFQKSKRQKLQAGEVEAYVNKRHKSSNFHKKNISSQQTTKKKVEQQKSEDIFKIFSADSLGNTPIENAIKRYNYDIAFYHIGKLESGANYALIIGTSDEWVNVITLNRTKEPQYEDYGYSITDNRWSYGRKVLGAPQFRDAIKSNLNEIKQKIATQEGARKEKENKKKIQATKEERESQEYKRLKHQEEAEQIRIQNYRKPIIKSMFRGINFEYNANKANHNRAKQECKDHYLAVNTEDQTCNCEDFKVFNSTHQKFDIRRLCYHLSNIIRYQNLLKRSKNELEHHILENLKGNTLGVYFGKLYDNRDFAIIAYGWTTDLFVATPKVTKGGYVTVTWSYKGDQWSSKNGGKKINEQILKTITEVFESQ